MNDEHTVQSGVSIEDYPSSHTGFTKQLRKLEVGDSFLWNIRGRSNAYKLAQAVFGGPGHISIRKIKGTTQQFRVWRVK